MLLASWATTNQASDKTFLPSNIRSLAPMTMRIHSHTIRRLTIIVLLPINLPINMPASSTGFDGDCIQHIVPHPYHQQYAGPATTNQHNSVADNNTEQYKLSIVDGSENPTAAAIAALQCQQNTAEPLAAKKKRDDLHDQSNRWELREEKYQSSLCPTPRRTTPSLVDSRSPPPNPLSTGSTTYPTLQRPTPQTYMNPSPRPTIPVANASVSN